jgi:hypothetical protein
MMKVYAVTLVDGSTEYDLNYEDAISIYEDGCRLWESVNGGMNYFEIFVP